MNNFSIVIPIFNEQDNIKPLLDEIIFNLKIYDYEVVIVDDGSSDNSQSILNAFVNYKNFCLLKNKTNLGQSFSLVKGIKSCSYETIVTIDGDGQNNPKDIKNILESYFSNQDLKLVGGIRTNRKDNIVKVFSSKIANFFRSKILKDNCLDTGCSLKVFDKKIFLSFPYFNGIHRFLPALFKGYGYKTFFIPVDHRIRKSGKSKYGTFNRLINGIIDIVRVILIIRKNKKN